MRKRWAIVGLIALLLLALGALWFIGAPSASPSNMESLTLERKQVGKLPQPPASAGKDIYYGYTRATLVDFDGDGAFELLALGEVFDGGYLRPAYTAWLSFEDGATSRNPLLALMPSVLTVGGDFTVESSIAPNSLPLLREVIAWDGRAQQPLLMQYTAKGWQTKPLAALKGEPLQNALATDIDQDGLINDYLLQTQSGKLAILKPDASGRIQLQKLLSSTPPEIEALFRDARASLYTPVAGATPLPATFSAGRLKLPDLDGDGESEWVEAGDANLRIPAHLRLSRSARRLELPLGGFTLIHLVDAVELDGAPPLELVVFAKKADDLRLSVYHVENDALQRKASLQTPIRHGWLPCWLRDLDGDGKAELILTDLASRPSSILQWRVFRYENGAFREVASHRRKTSYRLGHLYQPVHIQSGLMIRADVKPLFAWLTGAGGDATILVTLPKGKDALDPANWQFTTLLDLRPVWHGDYDGDGIKEILFSGWFTQSYLIQVRDGKLHGVKLSEEAVSIVLPTRIDGEPYLAVVYSRGGVELVQVRKP